MSTDLHDLSIVIVSHNSRDVLAPALESVYAQSSRLSFEVIVVDTGSRDGTLEEVRGWFPTVTCVEAGYNAGFTGGNNIGLARARGRYVLFLNPDTELGPNALDALVEEAQRHEGCGAVGPLVLNADGTRQVSCWRAPTLRRLAASVLFLDYLPGLRRRFSAGAQYDAARLERTTEVDVVSGCCLLAPKRVIDEIGGFDDDYWMYGDEDDLCERIRRAGYRVLFAPSTRIVHYGGARTADHALPWRLLVERNRRLFFAKHRGRASLLVMRALLLIDGLRRVATSAAQCALTLGRNKSVRLKAGRSLGVLGWQLGLMRRVECPAHERGEGIQGCRRVGT